MREDIDSNIYLIAISINRPTSTKMSINRTVVMILTINTLKLTI